MVSVSNILIFRNLQNIIEAQIIQETKGELKVKIVCGEKFSNLDESNLRNEFRNRMGREMKVNLDYVKSIPKDKNGKFRSVISKLTKV